MTGRTGAILFGFLFPVVTTNPLSSQRIEGRVVDYTTTEPIEGVRVSLVRGGGETVASYYTLDDGSFTLPVPSAGDYLLTAHRLGYAPLNPQTVALEAGDSAFLGLEIRLAASPIVLDPVLVTGESHDARDAATFHGALARRLYFPPGGTRRVVLESDPEFRGATQVRDILRWLPTTGNCTIVFRDGRPQTTMWADTHLESFAGDYLAIEWYKRWEDAPLIFRNYPPEIKEPFRCDVVVLWTR